LRAPSFTGAQRIFAMLYLKNTLGGWSRSLTDTALHSFQGPNRWWKLVLYAVVFVLPGGSLGVLLFAWFEHRRSQDAKAAPGKPAALLNSAIKPGSGQSIAPAATVCQSRCDAPACRAAAGKQARQTTADSRP
jgi:hypothetical protein